MPQMNKGGKFSFGEAVIRSDGLVQLLAQVVDEQSIVSEETETKNVHRKA